MIDFKNTLLIVGLLSIPAIASEYNTSIQNVETYETESLNLAVQNLSSENIEIDLYGEVFNLTPASGLSFECLGYNHLEIQIKNNIHEYFEVPCNSKVVFTESFSNQYHPGE